MSEKDGGPAYPHCYEESGHPRWRESQGMSLRDYFAGQALMGITAQFSEEYREKLAAGIYGGLIPATAAYRIADAMLKARTQGE